jgi:hypothetical protein
VSTAQQLSPESDREWCVSEARPVRPRRGLRGLFGELAGADVDVTEHSDGDDDPYAVGDGDGSTRTDRGGE